MQAIRANRAPDYLFLSYDITRMRVEGAFVVPGHFMVETVISKRPPLPPTARRAGWVGSNIHLSRIPDAAKVSVIREASPVPPAEARKQFAAVAFVHEFGPETRGWLSDVMDCLENLGLRPGDQIDLATAYGFEARLKQRHPANRNIRPKIRQQLQILVTNGILQRVRPGVYTKV